MMPAVELIASHNSPTDKVETILRRYALTSGSNEINIYYLLQHSSLIVYNSLQFILIQTLVASSSQF